MLEFFMNFRIDIQFVTNEIIYIVYCDIPKLNAKFNRIRFCLYNV